MTKRTVVLGTNIDLDGVTLRETTHVAFREETIGEQGEENEFRQGQQFVSRENEAGAPEKHISLVFRIDGLWGGRGPLLTAGPW